MKVGDVLLFNNLIPHRSLDNLSSDIRWSLDLRWQHPEKPAGAFGVKGVIRMTNSGNPGYQIPWEGWSSIDKRSGSERLLDVVEATAPAAAGTGADIAPIDPSNDVRADLAAASAAMASGAIVSSANCDPDPELSTILVGPWLDIWEVVHENKHTRAWKALTAAQKKENSIAVP
eukprot:gene1908-2241_t